MKKVSLIGNLTKDATIQEINGVKYVRLSVAVDEGSKERQVTNYYDVAVRYGQNATYNPADVFNKGREVFVEGNEVCRLDEYQGQYNIRYSIWADTVKPLRGGMPDRNAQQTYPTNPDGSVNIFPPRHTGASSAPVANPFQ